MKSDSASLDGPVKLKVRVVPGASRSAISGWLDDVLKVRVSAQPEKGKANTAVVVLLSGRSLNTAKKAPSGAFSIL